MVQSDLAQAVSEKLKGWKRLSARKSLSFHFPTDRTEVNQEAQGYPPLFCHSMFGDEEEIAGFESLKLQIFFSRGLRMHGLALATGTPCESLSGGVKKTFCLCRRLRDELQKESPCWQHLLDRLLSVDFPGDFCESVEEFIAFMREDHGHTAADDTDAMLEEGELWAEEWDKNNNAFLQLRSFSVARYSKAEKNAVRQGEEVTLSAFESLHRRQEWLLRFYIDGTIPLEYDTRWRVLLAIYVRKQTGKQLVSWPRGNFLRERVETLLRETKRRKTELKPQDNYSQRQIATESSPSTQPPPEIQSQCNKTQDLRNWSCSFDDFRASHTGSSENDNDNSGIHAACLVRPQIDATKDGEEQTCREGMHSAAFGPPRIEVAGYITTYAFFALTGGDKLRISQVLVLPHHQGKGLGFRLIECIYTRALQDPNISAVLVENPAPGFSQLRDAVLLNLCFESGLLPPELLLPICERAKKGELLPSNPRKASVLVADRKDTGSDGVLPGAHSLRQETRNLLLNFTKEASAPITRLLEILLLAEVLPLGSGPGDEPDCIVKGAGGRSWRPASENQGIRPAETPSKFEDGSTLAGNGADPSLDCFASLRLRVKRRLWNEASGGAQCLKERNADEKPAPVSDIIKAQLQKEWLLHFSSYCRTLHRLRHRFVPWKEAAARASSSSP